MTRPPNVDYKVVLVFPGFGTERENAEQIIEHALEYLNTEKDEPGMRFAYHVFARLETVSDLEQAQTLLDTDETVAMMILHDLPKDERNAFTHTCVQQEVPVCHTVPGDDPPRSRPRAGTRQRELKVVIKQRSEKDEPIAHKITKGTLTAPLEGDPEVLMDRVGQLIAVMALGVMEHHWRQNPPQLPFAD